MDLRPLYLNWQRSIDGETKAMFYTDVICGAKRYGMNQRVK